MASDIEVKAAKSRALLADDNFKTMLMDLRQRQAEIFFTTAPSETVMREEAYSMMSALNKIEGYLQSAINDEKILNRRK